MKLAFGLAIGLSLIAASASAQQPFHTPPACWTAPRITHGPWNEQPGERAAVVREKVAGGEGATWTLSPNGAYRFRKIDPDFTGPPPWNTRIVVDAEKPENVVVELKNHGNATAYAVWVNEKLILVRVWWGRVLGADLLVDVEKAEIAWKETTRGGDAAFEQSRGQACPKG